MPVLDMQLEEPVMQSSLVLVIAPGEACGSPELGAREFAQRVEEDIVYETAGYEERDLFGVSEQSEVLGNCAHHIQ